MFIVSVRFHRPRQCHTGPEGRSLSHRFFESLNSMVHGSRSSQFTFYSFGSRAVSILPAMTLGAYTMRLSQIWEGLQGYRICLSCGIEYLRGYVSE